MKSLAERKKEKEELEKKRQLRRSASAGGRYRRVSIPTYQLPYGYTQGDLNFLKKKAENLLNDCKSFAPHQFYKFVKDIVLEEERVRLANIAERDRVWAELDANRARNRNRRNQAPPPTAAAVVPTVSPMPVEPVPAAPTSEPIRDSAMDEPFPGYFDNSVGRILYTGEATGTVSHVVPRNRRRPN